MATVVTTADLFSNEERILHLNKLDLCLFPHEGKKVNLKCSAGSFIYIYTDNNWQKI